jgi:hypothetical protein
MPFADWFLLLALGSIPLIVMEMVKVVQQIRRQNTTMIKRMGT